MTREELCKNVFKRAFYHAYNNYLLNDETKTTVVRVKKNRVFFHDSVVPIFYWREQPHTYVTSIIVTPDKLPSKSDMGKAMISRMTNSDDKAAYKKFVDDFNESDRFVDYDIYVESYLFFKQHLRHVYESYVEHLVNHAWFTLVNGNAETFTREIQFMVKAFDNDLKKVWPEQYEELLGLVLDNANVEHDLDKSFNECRSDIIHILSDSGVLETAE